VSAALAFDLGAVRSAPAAPALLERIGTRLANGLQDVFSRLGSRLPVSHAAAETATFGDWKAALPDLTAVARYRVSGWRGGMLVSFPPPAITAMVDACYGGSGDIDRARTAFSAAEARFVDRLASEAGIAIETAWRDVVSLEPYYLGCTTAASEVVCGRASDPIIIQRFSIDSGQSIEILYPAASLRALPALSGQQREDDNSADPVWRARLSDAVMHAHLPVRTVIARPVMSLDRLMALAPGDIIPVCLPAQVPLTVAGRLLAHGTIGDANGRAAISISRIETTGGHQ
jgi:flagellar motor switch protein FliM